MNRTRGKRIIYTLATLMFIAVILLSATSVALAQVSQNYNLQCWGVIADGGGLRTSSQYILLDSFGQQFAGQYTREFRCKPRGWVTIGQIRLDQFTKRIYVVEVFGRNRIIRYTTFHVHAAYGPMQADSRHGDVARLLLRQDSATGEKLL